MKFREKASALVLCAVLLGTSIVPFAYNYLLKNLNMLF